MGVVANKYLANKYRGPRDGTRYQPRATLCIVFLVCICMAGLSEPVTRTYGRTRARHAREVKFRLYEIPIVRQLFAISMRYARRFNDRFGASRQS